jgi:hypothetical protein
MSLVVFIDRAVFGAASSSEERFKLALQARRRLSAIANRKYGSWRSVAANAARAVPRITITYDDVVLQAVHAP